MSLKIPKGYSEALYKKKNRQAIFQLYLGLEQVH